MKTLRTHVRVDGPLLGLVLSCYTRNAWRDPRPASPNKGVWGMRTPADDVGYLVAEGGPGLVSRWGRRAGRNSIVKDMQRGY